MATQTDSRDYYEILHVSRDAPLQIIRGSYRMLMQQLRHHPDLGGDAAKAALINEAYAVLTNPERRAEYDARLDLLAQVSRGGPEELVNRDPAAEPVRALDPFRECVFCEVPHDHGKFAEVDVDCRNCGSPLSAAENRRIEPQDQRAVARIDKRHDIVFYTRWPQPQGFSGRTEDVSLHGLRFLTNAELIQGQRIKIVSEFVEAVALVSNCVHERHGWTTWCVAGVSFTTLRFVQPLGGFVSDRV
jgi:curved DNA-binding protein CbpA